jgi:hypothetical protein
MEYELYREMDESKIPNLNNLEKAFYEKSKVLGGVIRGKRVGLPYDWGTEAMAWNTEKLSPKYGELSYGDHVGPRIRRQSHLSSPFGFHRRGPVSGCRGQAALATGCTTPTATREDAQDL